MRCNDKPPRQWSADDFILLIQIAGSIGHVFDLCMRVFTQSLIVFIRSQSQKFLLSFFCFSLFVAICVISPAHFLLCVCSFCIVYLFAFFCALLSLLQFVYTFMVWYILPLAQRDGGCELNIRASIHIHSFYIIFNSTPRHPIIRLFVVHIFPLCWVAS